MELPNEIKILGSFMIDHFICQFHSWANDNWLADHNAALWLDCIGE